MQSMQDKVSREARRLEEVSLSSAQAHLVDARYWSRFHLWTGLPLILLAAGASASAFIQFPFHNWVAGALAAVVTVGLAVLTVLNPNNRANRHRMAANRYITLRNRARIFYDVEIHANSTEEHLVRQLTVLSDERDQLSEDSPPLRRL